jgi:hypothetical protein
MKLAVWLFLGLAAVTTGMVVSACAPKEKYCFGPTDHPGDMAPNGGHKPCSEVKTMIQAACEDEIASAIDAGRPPPDCGVK